MKSVCVDKLLRPQCVVIMVKCLKVLATCHELWVSGKLSNSSARQMDIPPLSRRDRKLNFNESLFDVAQQPRVQRRAVLCSRGEWHWSMNRNEKQTVAWEWLNSAPSVCVRFTLQGLKFSSNCSASHGFWDCLIPLPHRVRSGTFMVLNPIGF